MHNQFSHNIEYNECTARGSCSLSPSVSAVQEVVLVILKQTAYYLQKLNLLEIGIREESYELIKLFANNIISTAYNENEIVSMINLAYQKLVDIRKKYYEICKKSKIAIINLPNKLTLDKTMSLSQIIALGEKFFQERYQKNTSEKRNYIEFLTLMIKNTAHNITTIQEYSKTNSEIITDILFCINLLNRTNISFRQYKRTISKLSEINISIFKNLYKYQTEKFGTISKTEINYSTKPGKAILVSGSNLVDLLNLLEETKNQEIDIYTHDNLIIAHAFSKFKEYANLKGQFGNCQENCILDFALFPGTILITKNSNISTEYMYRGRIFTTSNIVPQGVIQVKNNDFTELISAALNSKGFAKGQVKSSDELAFDESILENEFLDLSLKLKSNEISNVVIIDAYGDDNEYIRNLIKLLPENVYLLSLSYKTLNKDFSLNINYGDSQTLLWKIFDILNKNLSICSNKISYVFSKCDIQTLSNIIYLKERGIKNIYFTPCKPNTIKPTLMDFIKKEYGFTETSTAETDYRQIFSTD